MSTILVTGGSGFIGSELVRQLVSAGEEVVNVDRLTYAAHPATLADMAHRPNYRFVHADVCDADALADVFAKYRPRVVMHLAAESHVDRSIEGPADFIRTNVLGTYTLLDQAVHHYRQLDAAAREQFRFLHVSTDEVFGSLGSVGAFTEESPYDPRSPYSASKAGADHLVRAWHHTYGLPVLLSNCSNNYGPFQFPEKLIPLMVIKAIMGEPLPVYGDGSNVRDWIHVADHVRALRVVVARGTVGQSYNIGGRAEHSNLDVVRRICTLVDDMLPSSSGTPRVRRIQFVKDRPGHDFRYAMDSGLLERSLGWRPEQDFAIGLEQTVRWYLEHREWWQGVLAQTYSGDRLGGAVHPSAALTENAPCTF